MFTSSMRVFLNFKATPTPSVTQESALIRTSYATDILQHWFPSDYQQFHLIEGTSPLTLPITASGYAFNAPST